MLSLRAAVDTALEHHPAVKPEIRALLWHRELQHKILLVRLVHRIHRIARPLIIRHDLPRYHIGLSAVCLEGIHIVHQPVQQILRLPDRLRAHIVHHIREPLPIIRRVHKRIIHQLVSLQDAQCREIRIAHIVLQCDLSVKLRIAKDRPGGCLLLGDKLRIVQHTRDPPHISRGVLAPALTADLVGFQRALYKRGHIADIVIVWVVLIVETVRIRKEPVFRHQLHDHILRGAYQVIRVAQI